MNTGCISMEKYSDAWVDTFRSPLISVSISNRGVRILLGWKLRIQTILQFPGKPLKRTSDFNFYGGIYRNVYLIKTDKLYITDAVAATKKGVVA